MSINPVSNRNSYHSDFARIKMNDKVVRVDKVRRLIYEPNSNRLFSGYGHLESSRLFSYKGQIKNGQFEGEGDLWDYEKGDRYKGDFYQGKRQGWGQEFNSENKCIYMGPFHNNKRDGEDGTHYGDNGLLYHGGFKENEYHGKGKIYLQQSQNATLMFKGGFNKGNFHGDCYEYNTHKKLFLEAKYENGNCSYEKEYFDNGNTVERRFYLNGNIFSEKKHSKDGNIYKRKFNYVGNLIKEYNKRPNSIAEDINPEPYKKIKLNK